MVTLQLSCVGVRYGQREILADISTPPLHAGEVIAVIGPNAAGKSTLFRRIAGLLAGAGEIRITGRAGCRPCYLPQDAATNAVLTVYESIVLARKQGSSWRVGERDLAAIDAVLHDLEIEHLAFRGLGELSGGQRQLVSIAQTLVRAPQILLLDEPTSALDLHRQFEVLSLLKRLARERRICVLASLHDINQALRFADRVMVLAGGRLKAIGVPREVITTALLGEVYDITARIEGGDGGMPYVVVEGSSRSPSAA
ncbi:ABC transporter ATP-binding protein [Chelatococcus sp. SYSU_G07232]|uniref:ABC transporter ATP-binding protein n=1 Tax=Chelatococcus albus TaxID=3047466 RepID=A0ABT7AB90_9HYPH|nr:ABC transporter ATP-binding protein [Chelatococcus sp. SYSU_G07232]MDJ1156647.1 ABC transporter ATP-binding protein [Chelatococcus sp. SYSU_G07232]